ncbi:hypothetical protein K1719_041309 [Acacia pycnantha]|nr:hypothetical protein K1719_041309 [Acacia pycnantha]
MLASALPIEEIAHWAHDVGAKVLVDACQSVPRMVVDVQSLNVDFLVASSHQMCGRIGIGFLYGKSDILSTMHHFWVSEIFCPLIQFILCFCIKLGCEENCQLCFLALHNCMLSKSIALLLA